MQLTPVVIDIETYWDVGHTLSKLNPVVYCTHKETEIPFLSYKIGGAPAQCIYGEQAIIDWCASMDWSDKYVIGHNMSGFDSMLLKWRLGVNPAMWGCTLAMAKPLHALDVGGSLAKLVKHYGIGIKDNTALLNTKGKKLKDFTQQEIDDMVKYNIDDTEQCAQLFEKLLELTTKDELRLIDMTTRMLVEPKFRVDKELLLTTLGEEKERKKKLLCGLAEMMGCNINFSDAESTAEEARLILASAPKFAELLTRLGVKVPMKPSPTNPDKMIPALAKTDEGLQALTEHEDDIVAIAAQARLGIKSTILETRIEKFLEVSACLEGRMPIAKNYYGAHTGRFSGSMGLNQENLPRIPRDKQGNIIPKPTNALRLSLKAPKGYKVVVADLSGIELRVNHFLWKVPSSMALFQADPEKADLYKDFASMLYGVDIIEVTKDQRQVGKVAHLGLGFGSGAATFQTVAKTMAGIDLSDYDAREIVMIWRMKYSEITAGWKTCHAALTDIDMGAWGNDIDPWGLCKTGPGGIITPTGMIRYTGLHREIDAGKKEWWYGEGRYRSRIYAGKVDENIVQHLARNILCGNILEIKKLTGLYPVHCVHDELIYIVPEQDAQKMLDLIQKVMRTPPKWWPELVTWSEGDIADTYGEAK